MRIRIPAALATLAVAATACWLTEETRRNRLVWDHFDVVKHGILYRSGQLNRAQLATVVERYGIRTLINFQVPGIGKGVEIERALARRLRIDFVNLPMPGDGFGQEAQFREVLKACDDPARRPVLIHCARGTCRTGAAVALFRFERDGDGVRVADKRLVLRAGGWAEPERPLLNHLGLLVDEAERVEDEARARGLEIDKVVDAENTRAVFLWGPDRIKLEYVEHKPGFSLV